MTKTFDFIIIGGGTSGSCLANRLSKNPENNVLLLEAGSKDAWYHFLIHAPGTFIKTFGNPIYDWKFETEHEPFLNNRRLKHPRGKILGGSSSINAAVYNRGNQSNYDEWGDLTGDESWNFKNCLPYFKKIEHYRYSKNELRGQNGAFNVVKGPADHVLDKTFLKAAEQAGLRPTDSPNGSNQEGFSIFEKTQSSGKRQSSSQAYLQKISSRKNLTIKTGVIARQLIFNNGSVEGVKTTNRFGKINKYFGKEIILSARAFHTPHLLMLSGIGPENELKKHSIPLKLKSEGVGKNLQDHLKLCVQHVCKQPVSYNPQSKRRLHQVAIYKKRNPYNQFSRNGSFCSHR